MALFIAFLHNQTLACASLSPEEQSSPQSNLYLLYQGLGAQERAPTAEPQMKAAKALQGKHLISGKDFGVIRHSPTERSSCWRLVLRSTSTCQQISCVKNGDCFRNVKARKPTAWETFHEYFHEKLLQVLFLHSRDQAGSF